MKTRKNIAVFTGLTILAIIFIITALIIFFNHSGQNEITGKLDVYMHYDTFDEEYIIYSTENGVYRRPELKEGKRGLDGKIYIVNGKDNIVSAEVWVEKDGNIIDCKEVKFEDGKAVLELAKYGKGNYDISIAADEYYISTGAAFLKAVENKDISGNQLSMINNIEITDKNSDEINFKYPFIWKTNNNSFFTEQKFLFSSENEGKMIIQNDDKNSITCGQIRCETPFWDYEINNIFGEFSEKKYYYINARTVNGRTIDTSAIYIDSADKLNDLLSDGEVMIKEGITKVELNIDGELEKIFFDAPDIDLVWTGSSAPEKEYVEKYMNVKSYNGESLNKLTGGKGKAKLISGTIYGKNKDKYEFVIDGNYLNIELSYTDNMDFVPESVSAKTDMDGTVSLKNEDGEYYCVVTDIDNNERGYKLNIIRKKYSLPIIYITTDSGSGVTSKDYVPGSFSIDYNGNGKYKNLKDVRMNIRGRGHSSWELSKKPYKIKLEEKKSLFGLTKAKEWVLLANHVDKSLMRNNLAMSMGSLLDNMVFVPHSYMVDLFVNGKYEGVYSICEQIEMKEGRVEGEKDSSDIDADYLVEFGGEKTETYFGSNVFSTELCKYVEIKTPDPDLLSEEQYEYIRDYFKKIDEAVINLNGYEEYIDIPSLIDWFILHEFSYNTDCSLRRSNFFLKKKGGKLFVAAPWDFDYAFGNMSLDSENYSEWICLGNSRTDSFNNYIKTNWMDYLLKDENFKEQLKARWNEIGSKLYEKALETIDINEKHIGQSAAENFALWTKCLGVKLQYESKKTVALKTYKEQVEYLRTFIKNRYNWMDNEINNNF